MAPGLGRRCPCGRVRPASGIPCASRAMCSLFTQARLRQDKPTRIKSSVGKSSQPRSSCGKSVPQQVKQGSLGVLAFKLCISVVLCPLSVFVLSLASLVSFTCLFSSRWPIVPESRHFSSAALARLCCSVSHWWFEVQITDDARTSAPRRTLRRAL